MKRIGTAIVILALTAGCGSYPPRAGAPAASAPPETPSRVEIVRAMGSVSEAVAACGHGAHGEVSVRFQFDSSGAVADAAIGTQYSWASASPGPGCDSTPDAHGHYECRRPHTPVPGVDECILRAARAARVAPFSRPTFTVSYPLRY